MPLQKNVLSNLIKDVLSKLSPATTEEIRNSQKQLADGLASAIDSYIREAKVNVTIDDGVSIRTATGTIS